jgi:hypothetical protein
MPRPSFFRRLLIAALCCSLAATLPSRAASEESLTFSALCFSPTAGTVPSFYLETGKTRRKVEIPVTSLGGPFKATLREGGFVDFFASEDVKAPPAVSVKIPAEGREHLLIVIVPAGKDSFQGRALSLPPHGFEGGSTFAMNLAPTEVGIRHGTKDPLVIKPGDHHLLTLPTGYREPMLPVQIFVRNAQGAWEIAQNTRWAVDRRFRSYLFLYQSPENKQLSIHAVPERQGG